MTPLRTHYLSLWKGLVPLVQTLAEIAQDVAEQHGVTVHDLKVRNRERRNLHPRHAFMARAYATGRFTGGQIALFLGAMDHTSVYHGIKAHYARQARSYPDEVGRGQ